MTQTGLDGFSRPEFVQQELDSSCPPLTLGIVNRAGLPCPCANNIGSVALAIAKVEILPDYLA